VTIDKEKNLISKTTRIMWAEIQNSSNKRIGQDIRSIIPNIGYKANFVVK
jgi:hypothetical protein